MKTIYEKAGNIAKYVRDIMYMQKYYMDSYETLCRLRAGNQYVIPRGAYDRIRGYSFDTNNPYDEEAPIFQAVQRKTDYRTDYIITLTSSSTHLKNFGYGTNSKYKFIHNIYDSPSLLVKNLPDDLADMLTALMQGICTNTIRETEFQQSMLHDDYVLEGFYLFLLLNDDLKAIQPKDETKRTSLCLGSTDIKTFIPARKAFIDLLDKKVKHDWRETILKRYGHAIG